MYKELFFFECCWSNPKPWPYYVSTLPLSHNNSHKTAAKISSFEAGLVACTGNPSTQEAKVKGPQVSGLCNSLRNYLKIKLNTKGWDYNSVTECLPSMLKAPSLNPSTLRSPTNKKTHKQQQTLIILMPSSCFFKCFHTYYFSQC